MSERLLGGTALAILLGLAAWQGAQALQNEAAEEPVSTAEEAPAAPAVPAAPVVSEENTPAPKAAPATRTPRAAPEGVTPMGERIAVIGLLNKRNGLWRDLTLKPGQAVRVGDVVVRLRACETTAPWEPQTFTGAFVQLDVEGSDEQWRRVFSGWLYKESPSLNVVEHPIYDVWTKSCSMAHPLIGPETIALSKGAPRTASRSSAPKSAPAPAPSPSPTPSAESSNDI